MSVRADSEMMSLYEAAYRAPRRGVRGALVVLWTACGIAALTYLGWAEPWSGPWLASLPRLAYWIVMPLVMAARAIIVVESFGYLYHRFFQHLGRMTRLSAVFRRNQMFHWVHHMIIYPIGRFYKKDLPYVASEEGIAWSWAVPALIAAGVACTTLGLNAKAFFFCLTIGLYAKLIIDETHSRFHVVDHAWKDSRYFHWLEDIHILHHWDQRFNFTIIHPAMDWLFLTYLSPKKYEKERRTALEDKELTVSDLTNWRYLLMEASPAEYAAFISQARRHVRSLRKVGLLLEVYAARMRCVPADAEAAELHRRTNDLLGAIEAEKRRESTETVAR
jgi:hypothetical protein